MFGYTSAPATKPDLYHELVGIIDTLTADEADGVANMANAAAAIWQYLPDLNWAGFYRVMQGELLLGPFQGKPACIRIAIGQGVCGVAASGATQLVPDVHAFVGHIACDAASRAELAVPLIRAGEVVAVLDLDSPTPARFDADDARGLEVIAALLANRLG